MLLTDGGTTTTPSTQDNTLVALRPNMRKQTHIDRGLEGLRGWINAFLARSPPNMGGRAVSITTVEMH